MNTFAQIDLALCSSCNATQIESAGERLQIVRLADEPTAQERQEWEDLVRNNAASGFMQSLAWAKFKRAMGLRTLHLVIYKECKLVGGAIFFAAKNLAPGFLVAPHGPVLDWSDAEAAKTCMSALIGQARKFAAEFNCMGVRIEPTFDLAKSGQFLRGFGRAPFDLVPRETLILNLAQSQEDLLRSMAAKGRYNIRLAQRKGVIVYERTTLEAVALAYSILNEASRRDGFALEPRSFFHTLVETMHASNAVKLLFAEFDGEVLGTLVLVSYGDRATYLYGGITNNRRELMAGYALQWHAMCLARDAGCNVYDMYGFDEFATPGHPYAGFSEFKRKFGGRATTSCGAHDYFFLDSVADAIVKALSELRV